jgi:hypothetical protein
LKGDIIMKLYEEVFERLRNGVSVMQIQEELRVAPSRLRRILHSKRFRRHMVLQREATRAFLALTTADQAYWIVKRLREISEGRNEDSSRKACYALLNTLLDGRDDHALGSTTPSVHTTDNVTAPFAAACRAVLASADKRKKKPTRRAKSGNPL